MYSGKEESWERRNGNILEPPPLAPFPVCTQQPLSWLDSQAGPSPSSVCTGTTLTSWEMCPDPWAGSGLGG
jgi:hypothetical protein